MAKSIVKREIMNIEGRVLRVPKRDQDGDVVWQKTCPICQHPEEGSVAEMEPMTTETAMRMLLFAVPDNARKPEDPQNAFRIMDAIRKSSEASIELEDSDYDFIQRLMDRTLENPEKPDETMALSLALWGMNEWVVKQQLDANPDQAVFLNVAKVTEK